MQFGERVRALREAWRLTQQKLAERLGASVSYISKVENQKLHFGDYPCGKFIRKLAAELDADEDELLLLADKVPSSLRKWIRERPEAVFVHSPTSIVARWMPSCRNLKLRYSNCSCGPCSNLKTSVTTIRSTRASWQGMPCPQDISVDSISSGFSLGSGKGIQMQLASASSVVS